MADTPACRMIEEIKAIDGVDCQTMLFEH